MLSIKQFEFNPFGECAYVVSDDTTGEAIVVDPGMMTPAEQRRFDNYITEKQLKLTAIVNTHLHLDHCFGDNYVRNRYDVQIMASADDAFLGASVGEQCLRFGMYVEGSDLTIDHTLAEGDHVAVGSETLEVLAVPGHSPGGLAFYSATGGFVFVGDSLFRGAIGRTDLAGGDYDTLVDSVKSKLFTLPDDTLVLPGHGPATKISMEKASNPYLR